MWFNLLYLDVECFVVYKTKAITHKWLKSQKNRNFPKDSIFQFLLPYYCFVEVWLCKDSPGDLYMYFVYYFSSKRR